MDKMTLALISALIAMALASVAIGADYDPGYKPRPQYDRTRPQTEEEKRRWIEERAVLRVNGMRRLPNACEVMTAYKYLPYVRHNLIIRCGPMSIRGPINGEP